MGGDSGVECCGDCAVEHGRRQQGLTSAKEYRVDSAEEAGRRDLLCGKMRRYGARRNARRFRVRESRFMRQ
jgi:hypothetical protein